MEPYPHGGFHSFIAALIVAVIALAFRLWRVRKNGNLSEQILRWLEKGAIVKGSLLFVTFIALWLTIRAIGFLGRVYLLDESHAYNAFDVLDIIAYVLAINLCLTLLKSMETRQIVKATMQSILVALLIFLPRATSKEAIQTYGQYGSAVILFGFSALLISLVYITKHFFKEEKKERVQN